MNQKRRPNPMIMTSISSTQCKSKYSFTKFNTISSSTKPTFTKEFPQPEADDLQQQLLNVKKLKQWDIDNLQIKKEGSQYLYTSLSGFYKAKKLTKEQSDLDEMQKLLQSKAKYSAVMAKTSQTNKVIEYFQQLNQKEQGSILNNNIHKVKSLFNYSLSIQQTQKDIQNDLNIDVKTLDALKHREVNAQYYRKVINDKNKFELAERNSLMQLAVSIGQKKEAKEKKEKELSELYRRRDDLVRAHNDKCIKVKEEVEMLQFNYDLSIKANNNHKETVLKIISENLLRNNNIEAYQKKEREIYHKSVREFEQKRKACVANLKHIQEEIDFMKTIYEEVLKGQRQYYFEILFKGYDTRTEGLVWVVRRLLEMNSTLEYHHFPKFLDHNEVNYIQSLAKLFLVEAQLILILSTLKKKQEQHKQKEANRKMDKMNHFLKGLSKKTHKSTSLQPETNEKRNLDLRFSVIFHKYKDNFKLSVYNQFEENRFEGMLQELKKKLFSNGEYTNDEENVLMNFFNAHKDQKDLFELIQFTREKIKEIAKEKEEMKLKQAELFKEKQIVGNLHQSAKYSMENELKKSALFGCGYLF